MVASAVPVLLKCYAGSRLYDTGAGRYASMQQLRGWLARGVRFEWSAPSPAPI